MNLKQRYLTIKITGYLVKYFKNDLKYTPELIIQLGKTYLNRVTIQRQSNKCEMSDKITMKIDISPKV